MSTNKIPSSKLRKYYVLKRLLNDEHLSYQRLSDDYLVSRSSIANDIVFIKQLLAKDNVPLKFDNSGTFIGGGEENKQKVIKRIITNLVRESQTNNELLQFFMDPELLIIIQNIFREKAKEWSFEISENYLQDIVISTSVLVKRGNEGHHIKQAKRNQLGRLLFQFEKYPLVYELLKTVETKKIYRFSQEEVRYLSYIILGNGFKLFMKDTSIPDEFKKKTRILISNVGYDIGVDLSQDTRLDTDLLLHLYQMVLRLQSDMTVINPLLKEIKRSYSRLYGVVWYALREFGNDNNLMVSDDEVAFVTIHFQAAIERSKGIKRILFVCPNGIGTSSLLSAKMHRILPNVSIIEVVSHTDLARQDLSDVDLIISTIPLHNIPVPVAQISPMLTLDDMKIIMNQYIDLSMMDTSETLVQDSDANQVSMLKKHVFFKNVKNNKEAIDYLLGTNKWVTKIELDRYRKSVFDREKLQSTYLGNGFVIPHGDPKLITHSSISILILDKPIDWGNNKADVISLLMVRSEDKKIIEPFMNLIMQGIENKERFISKMMEVNGQ